MKSLVGVARSQPVKRSATERIHTKTRQHAQKTETPSGPKGVQDWIHSNHTLMKVKHRRVWVASEYHLLSTAYMSAPQPHSHIWTHGGLMVVVVVGGFESKFKCPDSWPIQLLSPWRQPDVVQTKPPPLPHHRHFTCKPCLRRGE